MEFEWKAPYKKCPQCNEKLVIAVLKSVREVYNQRSWRWILKSHKEQIISKLLFCENCTKYYGDVESK